jgi:endonuclease YncB( thermonuclease family)
VTVPEAGWKWPVARVVEVHDGDSVKLDVDAGFSMHAYVWIRLLDVRAPELSEADGPQARNDVLDWLAEHAPDSRVEVVTYRTSQPLEVRFRQSFTRYLGLVSRDGAELNSYLIQKGWVDRGQLPAG